MLKFVLKTAVAGSICAGLVVLGMKVAPLVVTEDGSLDFGNLRFEDLIESYSLSAPGEVEQEADGVVDGSLAKSGETGSEDDGEGDGEPEEGDDEGDQEIGRITGRVEYSTTELTNGDVTATVVDLSEGVYVKNEDDEDVREHVFTGNGSYIFRLCVANEEDGEVCKDLTAEVDWIDKVAPEGEVTYDHEEGVSTTENVKATLTINGGEEVTFLGVSEEGETIEVGTGSVFEHVFTENGEFVFVVRDKAGNTAEMTAKVDWIVAESEGDGSEQNPDEGDGSNENGGEGDNEGGSGDDGEETPGTGDGDDNADDSDDAIVGGGMGANDPEDDLGEWEGQVNWGGGVQNDGSGESQIENSANTGGATVNNNQSQGWQSAGVNTGNWAQVAENGNGNDEALNEDDKSGVDDELSFETVSGEVMMDEEVAKDKNSKKDEGSSSTEVKEWYEDPFVIYGGAGLVAFVGVMIGVGAWVNRKK